MNAPRASRGNLPHPERNDLCPCGSGMKYKKCCAIRPRTTPTATSARATLGMLTAQGQKVFGNAVNWAVPQGSLQVDSPPRTKPAPAPADKGTPVFAPTVAHLLGKAQRLRAAARVEEAIPLLRQAARLDPGNVDIWNDLGLSLLHCGKLAEAEYTLTAAIGRDPKLAAAHYNLGLTLSQQGKIAEAIAAHRTAIAVAPKMADAHYQMGVLLQGRSQNEAAAGAFEKAAAAAGRTTKGCLAAVLALIARGRREEAIALGRRVRTLDPKSEDLTLLLSNTLAEVGRLEEAEKELNQALAANARLATAWFQLMQLRKMASGDRPFLEHMTRQLHAGGYSSHEQMLFHFALGKLSDDLQEFECAIDHFDAANHIRSCMAPLNRNVLAREVDQLIGLFPSVPAYATGVEDERAVLIVGMPRSGTTLVEQILSSHACVAAGGELGFWGEHGTSVVAEGLDALTRERMGQLVDGYQVLLREVSPDALRVTDKYPFNFMHLGLIRMAFPRAFIIHCRRHPVDTCLSIYATYFGDRNFAFMGNRKDLVFYYREYAKVMRHWREALPDGRFLEIDYEKLVSDRDAETRRLVSFCELEWDDACLRPERNRRAITTASRWQASQPVYLNSVERWRNYAPWLGAFAELMPAGEASN